MQYLYEALYKQQLLGLMVLSRACDKMRAVWNAERSRPKIWWSGAERGAGVTENDGAGAERGAGGCGVGSEQGAG